MSRPNKRTDLVLIKTGKQILLNEGISALTVSAICKRARVNPGMFVYNFKSKEEFLTLILNELHDSLFGTETEEPKDEGAYENLFNSLYKLCLACIKYPKLMGQVSNDTFSGDKTLIEVFRKRVASRMKGTFPLFKRAQAEGIISSKIDLPDFLLIVWPTLIYSSISPAKIMALVPEEDKKDPAMMISDEAIRERVRKCLRIFHPDVFDIL